MSRRPRLGLSDIETGILAQQATDPDRARAVIEAFGGEDTDSLVDAIEEALAGARAHSAQSLAPVAMLSHSYRTLRTAPIPMRVSMPALHRCCSIAWGGDADIEHYISTTN